MTDADSVVTSGAAGRYESMEGAGMSMRLANDARRATGTQSIERNGSLMDGLSVECTM